MRIRITKVGIRQIGAEITGLSNTTWSADQGSMDLAVDAPDEYHAYVYCR